MPSRTSRRTSRRKVRERIRERESSAVSKRPAVVERDCTASGRQATARSGGCRGDVEDGVFDAHPGRGGGPEHAVVESCNAVHDDALILDDFAFSVDGDVDGSVGLGSAACCVDRRPMTQCGRPGVQHRNPSPLRRGQRAGVPDIDAWCGRRPVPAAQFAADVARRQTELHGLMACDDIVLAAHQVVERGSHGSTVPSIGPQKASWIQSVDNPVAVDTRVA